GASILLSKDVAVDSRSSRSACVMYTDMLVEHATVDVRYAAHRLPVTAGQLASVPRVRPDRLERLPAIPGMVPDLARLPPGCSFHDRCANAVAACRTAPPKLHVLGRTRVACYNPAAV